MASKAAKEINSKATRSNSSRSNSSSPNAVAEVLQRRLSSDPAAMWSSTQEGKGAPSRLSIASRLITQSISRDQAQTQACTKVEESELSKCAQTILYHYFVSGTSSLATEEARTKDQSESVCSCSKRTVVAEVVKNYEERCSSSSKRTTSISNTAQRDNSTKLSTPETSASIMMTQTKTVEEQLVEQQQAMREKDQ